MSASAQNARSLSLAYNRPRYWPVIVGSLIILAVSHVILWLNLRSMTRVGYGDFSAFYCAGKIVRQGQAHDLYNLTLQAAVRKQTVPEARIQGHGLPFFHPAYESLIYAALAHLPYDRAYLLWNFAGLVMLLIVLGLLRSQLAPPLNSWVFLLAGGLGYFPVAETFLHGQDEMLLWLCLTLTFVSLAKGNERLAGGILSLGLFKFHLIVPIVIVLLFQRRWKLGQGFAAGGLSMILLSIMTTGLLGAQQYVRLMFHLDQMPEDYTAAYTAVMPNLRGALTSIVSLWAPHASYRGMIVLLSAAILAYAGFSAARKRADLKLSFSVAVTAAVLVSYHANVYDLTLLSFPLLFFVERLLSAKGRGSMLQWGVIVLLAFSPVLHLLLVYRLSHLLFWPILALFLSLTTEIRRAGLQAAAASAQST